MSEILCNRCNESIETRGDLLVTATFSKELQPFHKNCFKERRKEKLLHRLTLWPISGGDGFPMLRRLMKFLWGAFFMMLGVNIAAYFIWGKVYLVLILLLLLTSVPTIRFLRYLWPPFLIKALIERKSIGIVKDRLKKKIWEDYESKLPE